ncbi:hypothetical protein MTP03_30220 [Tsukamurella sp. PLM1]|nr:hypothetical protein MTP03_30220 [Tsukamurella sp. PLM1]
MTLTIGIDIGGTSVRAGVVTEDGTVIDTARAETPRSARALERCLDRVVQELCVEHDVKAVGLAVAGFLDPSRETVAFAPHLPWRDAKVPSEMTARVGIPVVMEHDANAAAWAEHVYGPARQSRVTCVVALGTGIGAGLLIDGALYRGAFGVAPELGHLQVVPEGGRATAASPGAGSATAAAPPWWRRRSTSWAGRARGACSWRASCPTIPVP